jgi:hypothetical protein
VDSPMFLRPISLALSALAIIAGGLGMIVSFLHLGFRNMADITAGASGFVAGAVLIGSGLLSLTMLATRPDRFESKAQHDSASELA